MEHHHLQWPRLVELIRHCEAPDEPLIRTFKRFSLTCPECRERCAVFTDLLDTGEISAEKLDLFTVAMAYSRRKAEALWEEIKDLDLVWARRRLERETPRWAMVGLLVEQSTRVAASDWKAGLEMAELALLVAKRLTILRPSDPIPADADEIPLDEGAHAEALGLAYAARGNAYRIDERYMQAQKEFALLDALEVSMPTLGYLPRSLSLRASLYCELHRFDEAMESLDIAQEMIRGGAPTPKDDLVNLRIKQAIVADYQGDLEQARRVIYSALELHSPEEHRDRLAMSALFVLIDILTRIPRLEEARQRLPLLAEMCDEIGPESYKLRLLWVRGRIALETGDPRQALALFEESSKGWRRLGHGYKWSLLSIERAIAHLALKEPGEVRVLAKGALPILVSLGVSVEVMAIFKLMAQTEKIDTELLQSLQKRLEAMPARSRGFRL
jgi:tetratricopeptide (TPR) repeat protein